jgi:SnoaL-like domain
MTDYGFDDKEVEILRLLLDRQAIRDCVETYFHALDSRRFDLLDEVFAPEVDLADGAPPTPIEDLKQMLRGVNQFLVSHHGIRNMRVVVEGDKAHTNCFALDTLLVAEPWESEETSPAWPRHDRVPGPYLRSHGLRYIDDLERRPEGWRIVRRRGPIVLWREERSGIRVNPAADQLRDLGPGLT